ncbi:hypothetical protein ACFH04_09170 [Streptomyces noboritoensis]|uniref:Uncharacterized protein n=1 Tax=Streptomyces noboritoensis TaxID=67337 RepID=A0ABV6TDK6_9ACTN
MIRLPISTASSDSGTALRRDTSGETDHLVLALLERLGIFDIGDDDDPDLYAKIEELHRRRSALNPEIPGILSDVPDFRGAGAND